jgi:hypothetical protein
LIQYKIYKYQSAQIFDFPEQFFACPKLVVIIAKTTTINTYFKRFNAKEPQISVMPHDGLRMAIVIPCFNEPNVIATLESILNCQPPTSRVEVIVMINAAENSLPSIKEQNQKTFLEIKYWIAKCRCLTIDFHIIMDNNLSDKKAGVGRARKIGMDEAARRLPDDGIIVGLDADSTVRDNYLIAIEKYFEENQQTSGCSIYFEHPIGVLLDPKQANAIIQYELHLRYFIEMQRNMGYPFAYQTIGSSMAVRNIEYQLVGGMNTRKAGEDFYFLHKFIKKGGFGDLNTTTVFPSARISDRVPFGTGRAIKDLLDQEDDNSQLYLTYHPDSFKVMGDFFKKIETYYYAQYSVNDKLKLFLNAQNFQDKINEIKANTTSLKSFKRRFYHWFDAFLLMKALHYLRDNHFPNIPIYDACRLVHEEYNMSLLDILKQYRLKSLKDYNPVI